MRVSELFEAQGSPGQGGKFQGGAYYAPSYDADAGRLRGSVKDWLAAVNITKEDIAKAMTQVKDSSLFKNEFPKAGLVYTPSAVREKLGTFNFKVTRKLPDGKSYMTSYQVHANGQIRCSGEGAFSQYTSPLKSPKPRMVAGDPVRSLVSTYTAALEELLTKWKKTTAKMDKAAKETK